MNALLLVAASRATPLGLVRRLMDAARAINEMVFAMLFIVAVGLGPLAGVLAIALNTGAVLAKLFSEAVEAIEVAPVEDVDDAPLREAQSRMREQQTPGSARPLDLPASRNARTRSDW